MIDIVAKIITAIGILLAALLMGYLMACDDPDSALCKCASGDASACERVK